MARRRRVVVTGAAGGIGEAIVRRFLASGDKVAGLDIDAAGVERLGQAVSDGGEFLGIPFDLAYIEEIPKVVRRIIERFGGVDVLVNNAYYIHNMSLREMAFDDGWRREVSVNLEAPLKLSQECARDMAARGWGRIINLSSLSADFPAPGSSVYAMLKGAVNSLTKGLALELVGQGIEMIRPRGTVVLIALLTAEPLQLAAYNITGKEKHLIGSSMCTPDDVRRAIELVESGQVDVEAIATHILPLEEVQRGMELARSKTDQAIKVILEF